MYLFGALLKTSIYYFTDTEPASSGIPAREVRPVTTKNTGPQV